MSSIILKPYGMIKVKVDTSLTSVNFSIDSNLLYLCRGGRITDENGDLTPLRGLKVTITDTNPTAPGTPLPNVPYVWLEGTFLGLSHTATYDFIDSGLIAHGVKVV